MKQRELQGNLVIWLGVGVGGGAVKDSCRMDEVGSLETSFLMQINSIL